MRRSSTFTFLLIFGLVAGTGAGHASSPEPGSSPSLLAARTSVRRLLLLGERAQSRQGGDIALARRRLGTASAQRTSAWLDWLPDFSLAVRRQIEQETDAELSAPRWRLDLEGQLALSLPKLRAIGVARASQEKGQAELEQASHDARGRTLTDIFELYLLERKAALVQDQIGALESLVTTMTQMPDAARLDDRTLLESYLGELRGTLTELDYRRREAAQTLATTIDAPIGASGIDPRLDLTALVQLIRTEFDGSSAREARIRYADVELEQERLRWAESQAWYTPELRSTTLALLPQGTGLDSGGSSFQLTGVTTEVALGFRLRPGVPALQAAQRSALAKSQFDEQASRVRRGRTEDLSNAELDEMARVWAEEDSVGIARAEFDETVARFARGERTVAELATESRTLLTAQILREDLLQRAVFAQIEISANDRVDLPKPVQTRREALSAAELDRRLPGSLERAPALKSARAEAERAAQRARSERFLLSTAVEAGVLLPVYESSDLALPVRPELSLSGSGSLATVVREASVLGRWSLDLRTTAASERAFEREARLRQVQVDLQRKKYRWAELEARLELAHARESFELATRASQLALEAWQQEQRWLEQGAATERDVHTAELAHRTARIEQSKAQLRQRSAELLLASYLGADRGTQIAVDESPEAIENWARQHFLPENQLLGFESVERRREAELEAEWTRAQTEALAKPTRGTTLTTQVVQGLRGGAFSFTLALSVALDSVRDAPQLTRAAEREGQARGRLSSLERELDEQRARVRQRFDEASALLETEAAIRTRLNVLSDALRREQAALPDVHPAVKQRQLDALRAARLESDRRRIAADEQRRAALLRILALGNPPAPAARTSAGRGALAATRAALIERDPEVTTADAAAVAADTRQPLPVLSALHPVGPFAIGSYSANRVVGPATTRIWRGDFGIGLALGLDESLSFLASRKLSNAADHERDAARRNAAVRAIHELGLTWTARELSRLSRDEETEARQQLEASVLPRFELGQVTASTLLEAQQWQTFSRLRRASDECLLRTQHDLLVAMGSPVSDEALDEYQRRVSAWIASHSASGPPAIATGDSDPAQLAAQERSAAADSATIASALRFVSPISVLAEARPARIESTTGTEANRESSTGHELLWVLSLVIPLKPKEFGALSLASARAAESQEELARAAREARLRRQELELRFSALRQEQAGFAARRVAAERAVSELARRLRAAQDQATIDDVAKARAALFEARRAEVQVQGELFETALLLEATKENR